MTDQNNPRFQGDRYLTLTKVLETIEAQQKELTPGLIIDISLMSPGSMQQSAEKEVWSLLANGIRHLRDGAPGGGAGSMTSALTKASLRSSSLAASIGVTPPEFQKMYFEVDYSTGHEAALSDCKHLIEAAESDLPKSRQIIQQKITTAQAAGAFGIMTDIVEPELSDLFGKVAKSMGIDVEKPAAARVAVPEDAVPQESLTALRKQMMMSANMMADAYETVCKKLTEALPAIPPPAAPAFKSKGRDFDF